MFTNSSHFPRVTPLYWEAQEGDIDMTTVRQSPKPRIERLLADIGRLKGQVKDLEREYQDGSRVLDRGRNDVQDMEWPLRRAESDNAQSDVSFEGRQASMSLDRAEQELRDLQMRLNQADGDSSRASGGFSQATQDLNQIIADSNAYPGALGNLREARSSLDNASACHQDADGQADWARNNNDSAQRELQWAEFPVRNVSYDRVGADVSSDARQASSHVQNAGWNLRDCDSRVDGAYTSENRSEKGLDEVERQLRLALQQL